jgi:hypothetical protein
MKTREQLQRDIEQLENELGAISELIRCYERDIEEQLNAYSKLEDLKLDAEQALDLLD